MLGIIGTGGHSKVISEILKSKYANERIKYFSLLPTTIYPWNNETIYSDNEEVLLSYKNKIAYWHVAIGDIKIRKIKMGILEKNNFSIINAIHDKSIVSKSVTIGNGTSIMAGAIINPYTSIDKGCIINTSASIDHDTIIGRYVNIGPGSKIAGGVKIGDYTDLGTGAIIIPNVRIGSNCIIGAGAVVINDISNDCVAVGVPAKVINYTNKK